MSEMVCQDESQIAPRISGSSLLSKVADVIFGFIPAACLFPLGLFGTFVSGVFVPMALTDIREGWGILILAFAVIMGLFGWFALITAIVRRWQGKLLPANPSLKFGLWCGLFSGLFFSLDVVDNGLSWEGLEKAGRYFATYPYMAYLKLAPALLTGFYLYRLSFGGKS